MQVVIKTKKCYSCKITKPLADFYRRKRNKDGRDGRCKVCAEAYQLQYRKTEAGKSSRKRERSKRRNDGGISNLRHRARNYGLTADEIKEIYTNQNECCDICEAPISLDKIQVDHNHDTGRLRGLLCQSCNIKIIGMDDKVFLQKALDYLEEYDG